jgi:hypothetical protein
MDDSVAALAATADVAIAPTSSDRRTLRTLEPPPSTFDTDQPHSRTTLVEHRHASVSDRLHTSLDQDSN